MVKGETGQTTTELLGFVDAERKTDVYDWYIINVDKEREVNINLAALQDLGVRLYIYAEDASKIIASTSGKNKKLTLNKKLTQGTYYLKVERYSYNGSYTLTSK